MRWNLAGLRLYFWAGEVLQKLSTKLLWHYRKHCSSLLTARTLQAAAAFHVETSVSSSGTNMINPMRPLMLMMLSLAAACTSLSSIAAETQSPQYLLFQIFVGGPADGVFHRGLSKDRMLGIAQQIVGAVSPARTDPNRVLGFSIGPIAMDQGADDTRAVIREAFEVALEMDMAVALHLDDYMFWGQARIPEGRLLRDVSGTTEWKDWSGTPVDSLDIPWLPHANLAPQMCYESPKAKDFVAYWTGNVVGQEVKRQYDRLAQAGKAKLFAGVIVGWESNMSYGYCSLSHLGYSAHNPPADFQHEREHVLQRHIEYWAQAINGAGIPKDFIFTHLATLPKPDYDGMQASGRMGDLTSPAHSAALRAPWAAFNQYSTPGFTGFPTTGRFEEIYDSVRQFGRGTWAMSEGTNVRPGLDWESYLAWNFNHGAKLVNIFGGFQGQGGGEFQRATESADAIAAYRKFLRGDRLTERTKP
jgi:hypothetical protein